MLERPDSVLTMEEFKRWMLQFDTDGDGKISREELRKAIKDAGGWFPSWKASRGIKSADLNGNGFIDKDEINNLVEFANKQFGIRIMRG